MYLTKKNKNKKKKSHGEKLEWEVEKSQIRWSTGSLLPLGWRRRTQKKKVEQRGRQHKMTKMRGSLKLRRVEIEECD